MTNDRWDALLQAAGIAEAADEAIDVESLASDLSTSVGAVWAELDELQGMGLVFVLAEDKPPRLRNAGRQWLAREWEWRRDVLHFLPVHIDDLHARHALIDGGTVLVDEFRYQILSGRGVEHARDVLVPSAFAEAVDEALD